VRRSTGSLIGLDAKPAPALAHHQDSVLRVYLTGERLGCVSDEVWIQEATEVFDALAPDALANALERPFVDRLVRDGPAFAR
jgi:hypothetical protein